MGWLKRMFGIKSRPKIVGEIKVVSSDTPKSLFIEDIRKIREDARSLNGFRKFKGRMEPVIATASSLMLQAEKTSDKAFPDMDLFETYLDQMERNLRELLDGVNKSALNESDKEIIAARLARIISMVERARANALKR